MNATLGTDLAVPTADVRGPAPERRPGQRKHRRGARRAVTAVAVVVTAIFVFPLYWAVNIALQTTQQENSLPLKWFPTKLRWHNLVVAWDTLPFGSYLIHTVIIVVLVTIGSVLSASAVAYGLGRLRFPGREFLFNAMLATLMLPFVVTLIPLFIIFKDIGWLDTYYPLIVPLWFGGGPFNIFLLRQFVRSLPRDLDEAARVDGAGYFRVYWSVILPNIRPALAVTAWMTALATWGDFLTPLIYLSSPRKWTLALGLYAFPSAQPAGWSDQLLVGIALIMIVPVLVGFFFIQRWLIEGVNLSGVAR